MVGSAIRRRHRRAPTVGSARPPAGSRLPVVAAGPRRRRRRQRGAALGHHWRAAPCLACPAVAAHLAAACPAGAAPGRLEARRPAAHQLLRPPAAAHVPTASPLAALLAQRLAPPAAAAAFPVAAVHPPAACQAAVARPPAACPAGVPAYPAVAAAAAHPVESAVPAPTALPLAAPRASPVHHWTAPAEPPASQVSPWQRGSVPKGTARLVSHRREHLELQALLPSHPGKCLWTGKIQGAICIFSHSAFRAKGAALGGLEAHLLCLGRGVDPAASGGGWPPLQRTWPAPG
jgi:hypothetical protein